MSTPRVRLEQTATTPPSWRWLWNRLLKPATHEGEGDEQND